MTLEVGFLLNNRYRIESILGRGGMGAVYKATDVNIHISVAVKENLFSSEQYERQFMREALLLAALRHPNLPRVTDHFIIPGVGQYLVMDFIEGEDLGSRIARGDLPTELEVVGWAVQICDALQYIHTRVPPIIHRDIKPGNIRIMPDGRAMLVDFGLARTMENNQTTAGAKALTPGFSPPEQFGASHTDSRTDIYSLGATLYILLTGALSENSIDRILGRTELTPILVRNPKISLGVARAVEKALERMPEDRYQTAEELKKALTEKIHPQRPTAKAAPGKEKRQGGGAIPLRTWIIGGIGLLLVVAAAAAIFTITSLPSQQAPISTLTIPSGEFRQPTTLGATKAQAPTIAPSSTPFVVGDSSSPVIAFVSDRTGRPQVYSMRLDGSELTQITTLPDGACQPDWSPDGTKLLFISPCINFRGSYNIASIFISNANGSDVQKLPGSEKGDLEPAWSPDGKRIAFASYRKGLKGIFVMNADGTNSVRLSKFSAVEEQPRWSPDGKRIVFAADTGNNGMIWSIAVDADPANQHRMQISNDSYPVFGPDWNRDGKRILYLYGRDNGLMMFVYWNDLLHPWKRTQVGWRTTVARFSPDGKWILFDRRGEGNPDLYLLPVDGMDVPEQITFDPATDTDPTWKPFAGAN